MPRMLEILAGAALGMLVGTVVGLSASPVTGSLLAGLLALLAGFFGLRADAAAVHLSRVVAFGATCTVALVFAIHSRANNTLGGDLNTSKARWEAVGLYTPAEVKRLVALEVLGVDLTQTGVKPDENAPGRGVLHAADASTCAILRPDRHATPADWRTAFEVSGGQWRALANAIAAASPEVQQRVLTAVYTLACPQSQ